MEKTCESRNLEPVVLDILETNVEARNDDFVLYLEVASRRIDTRISLGEALRNHKSYKLPSFESVSRCRRKLMERYPDLKDTAVELRCELQDGYYQYALDI